jgi:RNA-directed DNA polymerase
MLILQAIVEMREDGLVMARYGDGAVVLHRSREEAQSALARMRAWMSASGLTLHPDKTHVGDCRVTGQGFELLVTGLKQGSVGCARKA